MVGAHSIDAPSGSVGDDPDDAVQRSSRLFSKFVNQVQNGRCWGPKAVELTVALFVT